MKPLRFRNDMSALEAGDSIFFEVYKGREIKGMLLTDSKYISNERSGLHYADVLWDDNTLSRGFILNKNGVRISQ